MFYAYIFFIIASILLMGAALSPKSLGFTLMYIIYLGIDGIGFLKNVAMITIKENFLPQDLIEKVAEHIRNKIPRQ